MDSMIFRLILMPLAVWRIYRLIAIDTGPKCILRKFRIMAGVKYIEGTAYKEWYTDDGSFAEMITCSKCCPLWISFILLIPFFLASNTVYLVILIPFNTSALALITEAVYSRVERK